jgi:hypothetical protein
MHKLCVDHKSTKDADARPFGWLGISIHGQNQGTRSEYPPGNNSNSRDLAV